jgi:hypothetical protein
MKEIYKPLMVKNENVFYNLGITEEKNYKNVQPCLLNEG